MAWLRKRGRADTLPSVQRRRPRVDDSSDLPPGPGSLDEAFGWPIDFLSEIIGHADNKVLRLRDRLRAGIALRTWYSGMDCPHLGLLSLESALLDRNPDMSFRIVNEHACDIGETQRRVLLSYAEPHRARHVFGDILERVPIRVRSELEEAERIANARYERLHSAGTDANVAKDICGKQLFDMLWGIMEEADLPFVGTAYCFRHDKACPLLEEIDTQGMLQLAIAGVTCVDVYSFGSRKNLLGKSIIPWIVWAFERRKHLEHIIIQECNPLFPLAIFERALGATHHIHHVVLAPTQFGWPHQGSRGWSVAVRREKCTLTCHLSIGEASLGRLFRSMRLSGSCFFAAPEQDVLREKASMASKRHFPRDFYKTCKWEDLLPPGTLQRLNDYDTIRGRDKNGEPRHHGPHSVDDDFAWISRDRAICDIGQDANTRCILSDLMPRLLTKSFIFNLSRDTRRCLIGEEHLLAQGVPLYDFYPKDESRRPWHAINPLSPREMRMLAGNAMCVPVVGQLLGFILAIVVDRPVFNRPVSARSVEVVELSDDE